MAGRAPWAVIRATQGRTTASAAVRTMPALATVGGALVGRPRPSAPTAGRRAGAMLTALAAGQPLGRGGWWRRQPNDRLRLARRLCGVAMPGRAGCRRAR